MVLCLASSWPGSACGASAWDKYQGRNLNWDLISTPLLLYGDPQVSTRMAVAVPFPEPRPLCSAPDPGGEMTVSIGPTVRRRRLGTELRRLRESHSFKLEEVADQQSP